MDLVSKVTADLRPLDEPLRWMISDVRAIKTSDIDHLWTRILDVKAALEARTYEASGRIVIAVTDRLGFAEGTFALDIAESGTAVVTAVDEPADVFLSVNELSSIYLGGVSPLALARADRISGDAALLATMFSSPVAPWLDIWF
jgi:predicted acetyltransferase